MVLAPSWNTLPDAVVVVFVSQEDLAAWVSVLPRGNIEGSKQGVERSIVYYNYIEKRVIGKTENRKKSRKQKKQKTGKQTTGKTENRKTGNRRYRK